MKKLFAIVMLALLLFNTGGYMLLFQYCIYRSDASIIENINNNHYKSTDLVEVKIPVHLNISDWSEFEVISGQVQLKDNSYNYAELKLTRDTMYLLCIPNNDKSRLINANIIYAKQVTDIPLNKRSHQSQIKKNLSLDQDHYSTLLFEALAPVERSKAGLDFTFSDIIKTPIDIPGQPPEAPAFLS